MGHWGHPYFNNLEKEEEEGISEKELNEKIIERGTTMLKGKSPEKKEKRLKMFVYGTAGVGKTIAALQFPCSYIIDLEKGTDFYADMISKQKSVVLQTTNPDDVKQELHELLTIKHDYKTLIIDPITIIYLAIQEKWNRLFEKNTDKKNELQDYGMRYWGKIKQEYKALERMILALDMNVIVTSHQKDVYGANFSKMGVTWDSMRGDDYLFDLIFRIEQRGKQRIALTIKERAEIGKQKFPDEFEWSYDNFLKFYGKDIIEKEATPVVMATLDQVKWLNNLIETVKIDDDIIEKWLSKASVDSFEEMTSDTIQKCISHLEEKMKKLTKGGQ